jgi:hypothetical protein
VLIRTPERKRPLAGLMLKLDNIKMGLKETGLRGMDRIHLGSLMRRGRSDELLSTSWELYGVTFTNRGFVQRVYVAQHRAELVSGSVEQRIQSAVFYSRCY